MAATREPRGETLPARCSRTLLSLLIATLACSANAGTEIALRFFDDNEAARGPTLSATAQAAVENAAGMALIARGRDGDGAHRFAFASEPTPAQLREALNKLRATGALVYADIASDEDSVRAKYYAQPAQDAVTSLIVRMKGTSAAMTATELKSRVVGRTGVKLAGARTAADGAQVIYLASPLSSQAAAKLAQRLSADLDVAQVDVDRRAQPQAIPADPMYASQWNLNDPVGGIAAPRAWDVTTGDANAPIAILDTGVLAHPDLAGRIVGGYDFVADARFAGDGDGRDADPSDPGDFVTAEESQAVGGPLEGCRVKNSTWHGTMVAGTLGAAVNNGNGMSGVNWTSPIVNVRVMGKCGGALSDVADGIRWASGLPVAGVPANPNPARVINLSLVGPGQCVPILQSAITDALGRGAVIVVAAGNGNDDVANHWPANCMGVIAVAATSRDGSRAFYSNSGSRIAISAPGGGIGGNIPVLRNLGTTAADPNGYGYGSQYGSSLAAPHIAGLASLVLARDRDLSAAEVRGLIETNARPFPAVQSDPCATTTCGAGIADGVAVARVGASGNAPLQPAPAPPGSTINPAPMPTPGPGLEPTPTAREPEPAPPPVRLPVDGGWQAKSPYEGQGLTKEKTPVGASAGRGASSARTDWQLR